jgi:hypothetical protein
MMSIRALVACVAVCAAVPAAADVWDVQTDNDNTSLTDNELIHGSDQVHDLGALAGPPVAADVDWYLIGQAPKSSYELVVDGASGDLQAGKGLLVVRVNGNLVGVQTSLPVSAGLDYARSLRWENTNATADLDQFIRIESGSCTTECGPDDTYRVRFYETTFAIPRFNAVGGQNTVLLIQNPTNYVVSGRAYFWNPTGGLEHTEPFTNIQPHALFTFAVTTVPALVGKSGTITVSHNARYGDIVGKSVAIEPATGFSFDTPMVWRPR